MYSLGTKSPMNLQVKSRKVIDFDSKLATLASSMVKIMTEKGSLSLSAIQVGVPKAVFVIKIDKKVLTMVNPTISHTYGKRVVTETCCSFSGKEFKVARPSKLNITYQELEGNVKELYVTDPAVCALISHAMDHLDGYTVKDYCKHDTCVCNYVKNRKGSLDSYEIMHLSELKDKFGLKLVTQRG